MSAWMVEGAVVLLLGLIVGLLLRFVLAVVAAFAGSVGLAWLLGYVRTADLARGVVTLGRVAAVAGFSTALLVTTVGAIFLLGTFGGVLLTSRLRAFDRTAVG